MESEGGGARRFWISFQMYFLNNITESGSRKKGTIEEKGFVVVVDKWLEDGVDYWEWGMKRPEETLIKEF